MGVLAHAQSKMAVDVSDVLDRGAKWTKKLRSVDEFLALHEFSVPVPDEMMRRVTVNVSYFQVNYSIVVALMVFLTLIMMPSYFLLIVFFCFLW